MMRPNMQSGTVAAVGAPAPEKAAAMDATEEQARAIMCAAKRAVEETKRGDAGAGGLSLKKSLEQFLEGRRRKNKAMAARAAGIPGGHEVSSSSSSSSSN